MEPSLAHLSAKRGNVDAECPTALSLAHLSAETCNVDAECPIARSLHVNAETCNVDAERPTIPSLDANATGENNAEVVQLLLAKGCRRPRCSNRREAAASRSLANSDARPDEQQHHPPSPTPMLEPTRSSSITLPRRLRCSNRREAAAPPSLVHSRASCRQAWHRASSSSAFSERCAFRLLFNFLFTLWPSRSSILSVQVFSTISRSYACCAWSR